MRHVQRLAALTVVYVGLELVERLAYRAGVDDAGQAADQTFAQLRFDVDEDLQPFDATDVLAFHGYVTR